MDAVERNRLSQEARMQIHALRQIGWWRTIALGVSAAGIAFVYAGLAGGQGKLFLGIPGVMFVLAGAGCAVVLNLGLKNGRRNVEKILDVLDREKT